MQQYLYQATIIHTSSCLAHIHLILNRVHMIHVPGQTRTQGNESSNSVAKRRFISSLKESELACDIVHVPSVQ